MIFIFICSFGLVGSFRLKTLTQKAQFIQKIQINFKLFQYKVPSFQQVELLKQSPLMTKRLSNDCKQYAALVFLRKHFKHHYKFNNKQNTLKQKAKLICMQQTDMHDACMLVSCLVVIITQITQFINHQ